MSKEMNEDEYSDENYRDDYVRSAPITIDIRKPAAGENNEINHDEQEEFGGIIESPES